MTVFLAEGPVSPWKSLAKGMAMVVEEVTLDVSPEGVIAFGMSRDHINALHVSFPKGAFDRFECPEPLKITMRIQDLVKVIDNADEEDKACFFIDQSVDNGVAINFTGSFSQKYEMHLVDPTNIYKKKGLIAPGSTRVKIDRMIFKSGLEKISKVSEEVNFIAKTTGEFYAAAKTDPIDSIPKGALEFPQSSFANEFICPIDSSAIYYIDRIISMSKLLNNCTFLEVTFGINYPLVLMADLDKLGSRIGLMQGPFTVT